MSIEKLLGGIEDKTQEKEDKIHQPHATKPKHIKLFLASSGDMKEERQQVELLIGKENRKLIQQNICLDLVIWEDLKQSSTGKRIQD